MVSRCVSAIRRSTPMCTARMANRKSWHAIFRIGAKTSTAPSSNTARSCFPPDRSIHERPDYVKTRETFGEWEVDLMIFERAQGKTNVASLIERKTRFAVLFRNNDRSTTHLMNRLMTVMEPLPQPARKSITFDRGIEFRN